jgi:histidinol-phosphatase
MMSGMVELERAMQVARQCVERAGAAALRWFGGTITVERKADESPVTVADRQAEAAILDTIRAVWPDHDFLGEESGSLGAGSSWRWIVDPLDGTRGFTRGGRFWGPLVALEHGGRIVAGAMALPALDEVYWGARGLGAWCNGERLQVSGIRAWQHATLSLGELSRLLAPPLHDGVVALARSAASTRCYGDLAAATLLLRGRAECWIEAGVRVWDVAPMQVMVEEAGGRLTDLSGGRDLQRGDVVATNGVLHDHVMNVLAGGTTTPRSAG